MFIKFFRNENDKLKKQIRKMMSEKALSKTTVLGTVDDYIFDFFKDTKVTDMFISVDKKFTTYKMMEELLNKENVYIYNNNLHKNTKKENIVFSIHEDEIEMLFSGFGFTKDNLDNSDSVSIYIRGNKDSEEMREVVNLYHYYKNNLGNYLKLDENLLKTLKDSKSFRNEKINTIFEEMQIDEVICSFRNKESAYKNIYKNNNDAPSDEDIDIEINID